MGKGQIAWLIALVAITGCGADTAQRPSLPSASPAGGVVANLTCRLAVTSGTTAEEPAPGGWVTFPGGQFVRDPASEPNRLVDHIPSYDRAPGVWVPVEPENVAPDGAHYVLNNASSLAKPFAFYLADAKTGNRRLLLSQDGPVPGSSWKVVKYTSEGIYLWTGNGGMEKPVPGLWLLDPQSGHVRLIDGSHYWGSVAGGSAWALDPPYVGATSYKVYRLDLGTGVVTTLYQTESAVTLLSPTPDGEMLIDYGKAGSPKLALLAASGSFIPVELPSGFPSIYSARLANPGVWLALYGDAWSGIALYVKGEGVTIMARSQYWLDAAGSC